MTRLNLNENNDCSVNEGIDEETQEDDKISKAKSIMMQVKEIQAYIAHLEEQTQMLMSSNKSFRLLAIARNDELIAEMNNELSRLAQLMNSDINELISSLGASDRVDSGNESDYKDWNGDGVEWKYHSE